VEKVAFADRVRRWAAWPSVQIRLDLDTRCNLRCEFCSTGHAGNVDRAPFPEPDLETAFRVAGREAWSVFLSCGGEPLLHPAFERTMALTWKHLRHLDVQMVTNATLLNEAKAKAILDSNLSRIFFSVDSVDAERYARLRPGAVWETTRHNIERFMELRGKAKWPRVTVIMILMKENQEELETVANFCEGIGVDAFRVQHLATFADVPTTLGSAEDTPEMRRRLLRLQWRLFRRRIVFDHPFALRLEKCLSLLATVRLYRNPWGYLKYLVGGAWGALTSPCRRVGWEATVYRDGRYSSCVGIADVPWDPKGKTSFLRYLRQSRHRHSRASFPGCDGCTFHRPEKRHASRATSKLSGDAQL
jgi:MoaA/NifB/PqqE/SkfB family radical SAM enzyme